MAKGIGNGFPLAAVVTTPEIAAKLGQALHFNTFGGNPMASAVGLAVLEVLKEEKCQENSLEVGTYLLSKLVQLVDKYPIVGDVRGKGLMIGRFDFSSVKTVKTGVLVKVWRWWRTRRPRLLSLLRRCWISGTTLRRPGSCWAREVSMGMSSG